MSSTGSGFVSDGTHLEVSNKRKRDVDDHGDREQKKVHVEDSRISIEDLHLDVGEKYLLCRTLHPAYSVPVTEDLFARYGLEDIAASVARVDDNGVKKSVRKTYKNYMRTLSGAFDSVKKEDGAPDTMLYTINLPSTEWDAKYGSTAQIEKGLPEAALANLGKAMTMARGAIPKSVWNPSVLGELNSAPAAAATAKGVQNAVKTPVPRVAAPEVSRPVKGEAPRPKRNIKKRQYGDSSFEGYGEGYVDDDLQDGGYSTGGAGDDDDRAGGRKRPKKNSGSTHFQGAVRQNSYGPGMVGA